VIGEPRTHVDECESTQLLLGPDDPEGAIATTDHQTAGRGRLGRRWLEAPGTSVMVSVLLRPPAERRAPELSLVAAIAVARALDDVTGGGGARAQIKWPNDVLLQGRKVAGILAEMKGVAVVLGIGINVNQIADELPEGTKLEAASLRSLDGVVRDRETVLTSLLHRLDRLYAEWRAGGLEPLRHELAARDYLRGRRIRAGETAGVAAGIDPAGRLLVETTAGLVYVESGEIALEP
jgi:BirA family transcriptional regulator, biotin operon repressor / biotin---[acetyl-CoA-carboxylase] ligase